MQKILLIQEAIHESKISTIAEHIVEGWKQCKVRNDRRSVFFRNDLFRTGCLFSCLLMV